MCGKLNHPFAKPMEALGPPTTIRLLSIQHPRRSQLSRVLWPWPRPAQRGGSRGGRADLAGESSQSSSKRRGEGEERNKPHVDRPKVLTTKITLEVVDLALLKSLVQQCSASVKTYNKTVETDWR